MQELDRNRVFPPIVGTIMKTVLLLVGVALGVACSDNPSEEGGVASPLAPTQDFDPAAEQACETRAGIGFVDYATDVSVAAAFSSNAGEVVPWLLTHEADAVWGRVDERVRELADDTAVTVCYFDGTVSHMGGGPSLPEQSERFVIALSSDGQEFLVAGTERSSIPIEDPSDAD